MINNILIKKFWQCVLFNHILFFFKICLLVKKISARIMYEECIALRMELIYGELILILKKAARRLAMTCSIDVVKVASRCSMTVNDS